MMNRNALSGEHTELGQIADLLAIELRAMKPDTEALSALRVRLSKVLLMHLAQEDHLLYPELKRSSDFATRELAARFESEMGQLAAAYRSYASRWNAKAIERDWEAFRGDTRSILAALRRRIRREETELYPRMRDAA